MRVAGNCRRSRAPCESAKVRGEPAAGVVGTCPAAWRGVVRRSWRLSARCGGLPSSSDASLVDGASLRAPGTKANAISAAVRSRTAGDAPEDARDSAERRPCAEGAETREREVPRPFSKRDPRPARAPARGVNADRSRWSAFEDASSLSHPPCFHLSLGRGGQIRTADLTDPNRARYQTALRPERAPEDVPKLSSCQAKAFGLMPWASGAAIDPNGRLRADGGARRTDPSPYAGVSRSRAA